MNKKSCNICPLNCKVIRNKKTSGRCGANSVCYVAYSGLHYWEEPPISGTHTKTNNSQGPGSGAIFFSNCSLKCVFCQNYKISGINTNNAGKPTTIEDLALVMLDLQNLGAMNINLVTGTHYIYTILPAVKLSKKQGLSIPVIWNSSGYETIESIDLISEIIDVWLPDFKFGDNKLGFELTYNNIENYSDVAICAIKQMVEYKHEINFDTYRDNSRIISGAVVRHLLLPGNLYNSLRALKILFDNFKNNIKYSIMNQYTPVIDKSVSARLNHEELNDTVDKKDYEYLLDYADFLGIKDYYWQQEGTSSTKFIPDFK